MVLTPSSVWAPTPGMVAELAIQFQAAHLHFRPSRHSYSKWVCEVHFEARQAAERFESAACSEFDFEFCTIRKKQHFRVSVPVAVREVFRR
ncbi:MAG: hypothetical protein F6J93_31880 [Oscillatoria sp. SIO1A7]|nr:hypothetical protein [Oscillatoria sp. SIO1A7]